MRQSELLEFRDLFQTLARQFDSLLEMCSSCYGVNIAHNSILLEIKNGVHLSLSELVKRVALDKSTVSRHVQTLVEMGLVSREADPVDRRYVVLALTEAGALRELEISDLMLRYIQETFRGIPDEHLPELCGALRTVSIAMSESRFACSPSE